MACLILRAYLKTTYRGLVDLLGGHARLREALGMEEKLPHYTTLQKFSSRSEVLAIADAIIARIGQAALGRRTNPQEEREVAMDATGMETSTASAHFVTRSGRQRRRWVKLSMTVVCGALLPLGLVTGWGPTNDKCEAGELLDKSLEMPGGCLPQRLFADAGYDADWLARSRILYWGDIDTHGFFILNRLRGIFPHAESFLMNAISGVLNQSWDDQALADPCDRKFQFDRGSPGCQLNPFDLRVRGAFYRPV